MSEIELANARRGVTLAHVHLQEAEDHLRKIEVRSGLRDKALRNLCDVLLRCESRGCTGCGVSRSLTLLFWREFRKQPGQSKVEKRLYDQAQAISSSWTNCSMCTEYAFKEFDARYTDKAFGLPNTT